ncbi:MAG: hypothetical protein NVSMB22_06520 [Chloroflexota bacterium]
MTGRDTARETTGSPCVALQGDEVQAAARAYSSREQSNSLAGRLYQFHGYRVVDATGESIGLVDWIWPCEPGDPGEFVGVHLRWLRGTARAIPACDLHVDTRTSTIRVATVKDHIKRAPRYAIDRPLTAGERNSIYRHYRLHDDAMQSRAKVRSFST